MARCPGYPFEHDSSRIDSLTISRVAASLQPLELTEEAGTAAIARFEQFWARMPTNLPSNLIHPDDQGAVNVAPAGEATLQLQTLPLPVNGNLREADVVLLMLNPNYDHKEELEWEAAHPLLASRRRCLQLAAFNAGPQSSGERIFYDIDPAFHTTSGARYWRRRGKLGDVANALANERGSSLDEVWTEMARRIAVLQVVPYRSKTFDSKTCSIQAMSCRQAVELAAWLAFHSNKLVIAMRALSAWGFQFPSSHRNLIAYDPKGEARGASLSLSSRGGGPILERLLRPAGDAGSANWKSVVPTGLSQPKPRGKAPRSTARSQSGASEAAPPDRSFELVRIFRESGLSELLTSTKVEPPGTQRFSKLYLAKGNPFRLSSLELHDKRASLIFRVHYLPGVPDWIRKGMEVWPAFCGANEAGTNLMVEDDPLELAIALANLLCSGAHPLLHR